MAAKYAVKTERHVVKTFDFQRPKEIVDKIESIMTKR